MIMNTIKPGVQWVGALEWTLKHFHGHELSIPRGTSYNSYLIQDEKTVLIDLVRDSHGSDWLKHLETIVPISSIDILIVDHAEPDHASVLPRFLERNPNIEIICSRGGKVSISRHFPEIKNLRVVKTGDSLSIGSRTLKFFEAQMLHWPDTMFTYCPEDKMLFSADAFGQHYANTSRFADEVDQCELWAEALKYFVNILTPYSGHIIRKVAEFQALGWPLEVICPSHGMIWRKDCLQIVKKYLEWSEGQAEPGAVIIFDTIWGGTEEMAKAIASGIAGEGLPYKLFAAGISDMNDVMVEVFKHSGVLVGSPTLNNGLMPTIMPIIEELHGLRFRHKMGGAFGTYGWSGEGTKRLEASLGEAGIAVPLPAVKAQFRAGETELKACEEFGRAFARHLKDHQPVTEPR
jgi:anaerobic nitric oxide reductase flavorubredoxin